MLVRSLQVVVTFIVVMLISLGLVWLLVRNQSALDTGVLTGDITRVAIDRMIDRLRSALMLSEVIAIGWATACALIWTWIAARADPAANTEAKRYTSGWAGLFLLALVGMPIGPWLRIWPTRIATMMDPMTLWLGLGVIFISVFLGYLLATSLTAPPKLRVAVPGADFLYRTFRSKRA